MKRTDLIRRLAQHGCELHRQESNHAILAGHESARTTVLYDRRADEIALDDVGRIVIRLNCRLSVHQKN